MSTGSQSMTRAYYLQLRVKGMTRREVFNNIFGGKLLAFHEFLKDNGLFEVEQEAQLVKNLKDKSNEEVTEMPKAIAHPSITKEFLDIEFAKGKSVGQVEREAGMKLNTLRPRMKALGVIFPSNKKSKEQSEADLSTDLNRGIIALNNSNLSDSVDRDKSKGIEDDPIEKGDQNNEAENPTKEDQINPKYLTNPDNSAKEGSSQIVEDIKQEQPVDTQPNLADMTELKVELTPEKAAELKEAFKNVVANEIKAEVPTSLVKEPNDNTYITIHLKLKGSMMNRFDQRSKLVNDADEFVTGVEVIDLDFPRAASELFTLIQNFTYLVEAELQGLLPKGDVSKQVVEFFEYYNEKHLEKISGL